MEIINGEIILNNFNDLKLENNKIVVNNEVVFKEKYKKYKNKYIQLKYKLNN